MIGIRVPEDQTWQLNSLWFNNSQLYLKSEGYINTTEPNIIMVRPLILNDSFAQGEYIFYIRYNKQT